MPSDLPLGAGALNESHRGWLADNQRIVVVGAVAGFLGGMFGVGGGFIIVPGLIALARFPRRLAHGTSLSATLLIALGSILTYVAHDNVDWPVAGLLIAGAMCGAVLGTRLLRVVPRRPLTITFVGVVLVAAIPLFLTSDVHGRSDLTVGVAIVIVGLGLVAGTLSGMLGIGGGVVLVPAMVLLLSIPPAIAKGTSVATIIPSAIVGTLRNRQHHNVDLRRGATVGLVGTATAVVGGLIANSLSDRVSNTMFVVLLLGVAALEIRTLRIPIARSPSPPIT